jgi:thiol-disulfide isomerase/thioredoxin
MSPGRRKALAYGGAAIAAAAAGIWAGMRSQTDGGPSPAIMSPLDGSMFPDLKGNSRQISEWRGKVVAVNFWATWCAPCREEIPMFMEARRQHAAKGFEIVGIAIDNPAKVADFSRTIAISYPVLLADGFGLKLIRDLGNKSGGLPYTVFLDRQGRPVKSKLGALTQAELDGLLIELLG